MKNVKTNQMNARRCNSEGAGVKMTSWLNNNFKLLALTLLAVLSSSVVWGEDATVSWSDGSYSNSTITWSATNICTIYQEQNGAQTAPNTDYVSAPRWYSGNKITITAGSGVSTFTSIVITATSNNYATALANSTYTVTGGTGSVNASSNSTTVTISMTGTVTAFTIIMGGQSRLSKDSNPTINYTAAGSSALTTMAEVIEEASKGSTMSIAIDNWVVTGVSGNYAYVADKNNEKGITIYKSSHGFTKGNILNGTVSGVTSQYYSSILPELTNLTKNYSGLTVTTGGSVTPKAVTFSDLTDVERIGTVVTLSNVIYSDEYETLEDPNDRDNNWIFAGNALYNAAFWIGEELYNTTGVYAWTITDGKYYRYIYPRSAADIVQAKTISSIAVTTSPTKVTYTEGDKFDPTGLIITKKYSDNSTEDWAYADHASDFTFSPSTSTALTTSNTSVTITVGGKSTTQSITVNAKPKYTVTFYNAGEVVKTVNNVTKETLFSAIKPTIGTGSGQLNIESCDNSSTHFMGWTTEESFQKRGTAPSYVADDTAINKDMTVRAVWAAEE